MTPAALRQYRGWLSNRIPLLGRWLRRRAVEALERDGSPAAVEILGEAVGRGEAAALEALRRLGRLGSTDAREALCRLVLERDLPAVQNAVVADGFAPRAEGDRAVFWFLTEQWERYEALDFQHTLLRAALNDGDAALRRRIAARARQSGRVPWAEGVAAARQGRALADLTPEEWEVVLAGLGGGRRWSDLWRLAQEAPACRALPLLRRLGEAGWRPDEPAERAGFEELARLAQAWPGDEDELRTLVPCRAVLGEHDGAVYAVAVSPDGGLLASGGGGDNAVRLARFPSGEPLQTLQGHSAPVAELMFSPDGRHLASVAGRSLRLWAVPDGRLVYRFKSEFQTPTIRLVFHPDGRLLAFNDGGVTVQAFDILKGAPADSLSIGDPRLGPAVTPFALTPDGKTLIAHAGNRAVQLWSFPDGLSLRTLEVPGNEKMASAAVSADGKTLVTGGASLAYVWALPDGELRETLTDQAATNLRLSHVAGGGTVLVSWGGGPQSEDSTPTLRCLPGGAPRNLAGHGRGVNDAAFSPDDRFLASGSKDGTVRLWDVSQGRPLAVLDHDRDVEAIAFSGDGRLLVSAGRDRTVRLWGLELLRSASVPVGRAPPEVLARVEETLRRERLPPGERGALEFTAALMRWRRRFDITLDAGPRRIDAGEFDIVIEG